jgi:hypothetical protein
MTTVSSSIDEATTSASSLQISVEEVDSSLSDVGAAADTMGTDVNTAMNSATDSMEQTQSAAQNLQATTEETAASTDQVTASSTNLATAQGTASGSMKTTALGFSSMAMSGATLVMSVSNLENAEVSLDRAHLTLQKDTVSVQAAQDAYNKAVLEYGPNSSEATLDAQKLADAQDTVSVEQEKVAEAQRDVNNSIMMSAVSVIPTVISGITGLSSAFTALGMTGGIVTGVVDGLNMAMAFLAANPIILVIAGIALLAVGLYEAYEHCAPFRDAINDIGAVLGGSFKTALTDITNALSFLWNEVLVPIANFLKTVFLDAINAVMKPIEDLMSAVKAVSSVGSAIGGALGGVGKALGLAEGGVVTQPTLAVVGESGPEAVIPLDESMSDALNDASQGTLNANVQNVNSVGTVNNNAAAPTGGGNETITIQLTTNPSISIASLSSNASLQDIINAVTTAVNNGMAQPLVDALNRAFAEKQRRRS